MERISQVNLFKDLGTKKALKLYLGQNKANLGKICGVSQGMLKNYCDLFAIIISALEFKQVK